MDQDVLRAMLKWPDVPALFGWLRLDRRGHWYIQGQRVLRDALTAFIGRNYAPDEQGRWYFQNGPQRGFVELDYTPWVLRAQPDGSLLTHTGLPVRRLLRTFLDQQGSVLLESEHGIGLLADTDLDWAMERLHFAGADLSDARLAEAIEQLLAGEEVGLALRSHGQTVPITLIQSTDVPSRFGFVTKPEAGEEQS